MLEMLNMFKRTVLKNIFSHVRLNFLAAVLLTFLITGFFYSCRMFGGGDYNDSKGYTDDSDYGRDVAYSPDGKFVTIYFDGKAPPSRGSRSLTLPLAKMAVDYYEVVFLHSNGTVGRAAWGNGESAGVNGVYRTDSGVYYSSTSASPASGAGSALLFAGNRSDKTLLALGKISSVSRLDDYGVLTVYSDKKITSGTVSVTFELAALKAGTNNNSADSSFLTSAGDPGSINVSDVNTIIVSSYTIDTESFPLYRFPYNYTIYGTYTFKIDHSTISFSDYQNGIILAEPPQNYVYAWTEELRYQSIATTSLTLDQTTEVRMLNNVYGTNTDPVENIVEFEFEIKNDPTVRGFAFSFEIPVHNLDSTGTDTWFIRPAYGYYNHQLDNGKNETGAVLIGIGGVGDF